MTNSFKLTALLLLSSLSACHRSETASASASAPPASGAASAKGAGGPPVSVNTVLAKLQDVPVQLQSNATVQALSSVELHPQLSATVQKVHVREGDFVKAGQLLFSLDDATERANLAKARAQVARDAATMQDLERQLKRTQELIAQKFVTQSNADTLNASVQSQKALLQSDQAAVQAAEVASGFASIRAPQNGRVGEIRVFPGSLVQPATPLLTVTQLNPVSLTFTLPEGDLPGLLAAQKAGPVVVLARGGSARGKLSFIDNAVDNQSGVIRVKAEFENHDNQWWPGQYADVQLTVKTLKNVVVVPQAAVITSTRGRFVYTAEQDGSAKSRPINLLYSFGQQVAVSGLAGGEKVIVEGKQNLRPGNKVQEGGKGGKKAAAGNGTDTAANGSDSSGKGGDKADKDSARAVKDSDKAGKGSAPVASGKDGA